MAAAVALSDMETELGTSTEAQTVLVFRQRRGWERVKGDSSVRSSFSFFYFSFFLVLAGHPRVLLTTCMFKCCLLCLPFAVSNGCRWLFGLRLAQTQLLVVAAAVVTLFSSNLLHVFISQCTKEGEWGEVLCNWQKSR